MHVLHVLNSPGGGATQCAMELVSGQSGGRYRPFVVAPSDLGNSAKKQCEALGVEWKVIPIGWWNRKIRLSWPRRIAFAAAQNISTRANIRTVYRLVQCIKEWNIDIVHTHTGVNPWGAVAARIAGVRHVWHLHEPNGSTKPFSYWLPDRFFARTLSQLSDYLVCVSAYVAEIFERYPQQTPVEVVYQGIDVPQFSESKTMPDLRQSLGIAQDEVAVGMVAGLTSTWKRHDLFVELAGRLSKRTPKARFVVFGDVPGKASSWLYGSSNQYSHSILDEVNRRGLGDRLIFAGFHSKPADVMSAIDILVHPCEVEGFGRVAIEAMAAGRPVIGPNRGGISESVVDGQTGFLFSAGDASDLAAHCERLINNPALRRTLGENGRVRAAEFFGIQQHVDRISKIYDQVTSN